MVGVRVRLANGEEVWGLIGNVDASNPRLTQHVLTLSTFHGGRWFTMARYHDIGAEKNGPNVLARFLGLPVDNVFPIAYDIRRFCVG